MSKTLFEKDDTPTVTALAPWFGSNRTLAKHVGDELAGCKWVGVPFAGGMSELLHIKARSIVVSDLHKHVINLALCVQCPDRRQQLINRLSDTPFHPDALEMARITCNVEESRSNHTKCICSGSVDWAFAYFITAWMSRSAKAGTKNEFTGSIPVRWNANGGDSNTRFRSAATSLAAWHEVMVRCNFVVQDVFDFMDNVNDEEGVGVYLDAPWPDDGEQYKHSFSERDQHRLAERVSKFQKARIVIRYGAHDLIQELYQAPKWTWINLTGRTQANDPKREVLIINGPSYAER